MTRPLEVSIAPRRGRRESHRQTWSQWCHSVQSVLSHGGTYIDGPEFERHGADPWHPLFEEGLTSKAAVARMASPKQPPIFGRGPGADLARAQRKPRPSSHPSMLQEVRAVSAALADYSEEDVAADLASSPDEAVRARAAFFDGFPGSKAAAGVSEWIIGQFPPHSVYVECFLGAGVVLRRKTPALMGSVGVEIDQATYYAWSRVRWPGLHLVMGSALEWLELHGQQLPPDALVYADPPYLRETRSSKRLYRHEMDDPASHGRLLDLLDALPCSVAVSGYWSKLYDRRLRSWAHSSTPAMTRGGKREEWLWTRPSLAAFGPGDGRFPGRGFRERERIKRKATRWASMWAAMPAAERDAVLAAVLKARASLPATWGSAEVLTAAGGDGGSPRSGARALTMGAS